MNVVFEASPTEQRVIDSMRSELRTRLESQALTTEQVADRLGLVPEGVDTLMRRQWSFQEAFRIAEALGLNFAAALSTNGNGRGSSSNGRAAA